MSRRELIAEVLRKRQPLSERIDEARNHTQDILSALKGLDELIKDYQKFDKTYGKPSKAITNEEINTKDIQSILNLELENLRYLHERFSKPPLKIAVAGLPKEGKSTFIRAVTGLPPEVIPSSKELCTGASSTIYNHESSEFDAKVEFYSSSAFLTDVILPYYDELNLTNEPTSLDSWQEPSLTKNNPDAVEETKYQRLLAYYRNYSEYKKFLNLEPIRVGAREIRKYIAQVDENGTEIHIYRAVKSATIYTNFPNDDVGQIALVDTPGLGELRSKEEQKLVETLRTSADIVICIICPRPNEFTYQSRHTNFFRLMQKGIGTAEKRCLLILNDDSQNSEACKKLATPEKMREWGLKFARVFPVDCKQSEQVRLEAVDPILNYLADKIKSLDWNDTEQRFKIIIEECTKTSSLLEKFHVDPSGNIQYISSQRYRDIFEKDFVPKLRAAFKKMRADFLDIQDSLSVKAVVREKVKNLTFSIPIEDIIESRRNPKDTYDPVFEEILGRLRVQALRHFQDIDLELKPLADELRKIVAENLREIGLDKLSNRKENDFIEDIYALIPETCQMLKLAFKVVREFDLAYFWLIRVKIYKGLEKLLPEKNIFKPKNNNPAAPVTAKTVHQALYESCNAAKSDLLGLLGGNSIDNDDFDDFSPNSAVLAALEEIIDLGFYAEDEGGRGIVLSEWQDFLEPYKAKIWKHNFEIIEEEIELRDRLSKLIEQAKTSITKLQLVCDLEGTL